MATRCSEFELDAALMFEADPFTEAIVIFGEIGSSQEEELAKLIVDRKVTKPVIAYRW